MLPNLPIPTIFAHRGACSYSPENTIAAFELAVSQGTDAIELDAKLSADGQVVVIHDQTVDRTTGAHGRVGELALADLRRLDCGSFFDAAFKGERIPTLDEVFEAVGRLVYINVELTNYASMMDDLPERVAKIVRKHALEERVLFSSFNPLALLRVRRQIPQAPTGLLAEKGRPGRLARSPLGALLGYQALHPEQTDVTPDLVKWVHRRSRRVHTYTVNLEEDMVRVFNAGVDGIFTDDPLLAQKVRASFQSKAIG
jgi:glycerophosphoryl diester phosphodiesterase